MMSMTLEQLAQSLPHQGALNIGHDLTRLAAACNSNIVEIGSWLGSGTAFLALGARQSGARMHVYDRFVASGKEVAKASAFGVRLENGQDTLPLVRGTLDRFGVSVAYHKGPAREATWTGEPIGLFVLDAAKKNPHFAAVARTFFPFLEDGAVLVLMDFHQYEKTGDSYRDQQRYMQEHKEFEQIEDRLGGTTSAAVFIYRKPHA